MMALQKRRHGADWLFSAIDEVGGLAAGKHANRVFTVSHEQVSARQRGPTLGQMGRQPA